MSIINDPDIAYFYVSTILDKNTCQVCKGLDGLRILNEKSQLKRLRSYEKGIKDCISSRGCRCILVGVYKEEVGSEKIVADLKKTGGILHRSYFEEQERKSLKRVRDASKKKNKLETNS